MSSRISSFEISLFLLDYWTYLRSLQLSTIMKHFVIRLLVEFLTLWLRRRNFCTMTEITFDTLRENSLSFGDKIFRAVELTSKQTVPFSVCPFWMIQKTRRGEEKLGKRSENASPLRKDRLHVQFWNEHTDGWDTLVLLGTENARNTRLRVWLRFFRLSVSLSLCLSVIVTTLLAVARVGADALSARGSRAHDDALLNLVSR